MQQLHINDQPISIYIESTNGKIYNSLTVFEDHNPCEQPSSPFTASWD